MIVARSTMKLPIMHVSPTSYYFIIFFSAPLSEIPSVYALPLMSEAKFNNHAKL
jgi:hypothetical protein